MTNATPDDLLRDGQLRRELADAIAPYVGPEQPLEHIGGYLGRSAVFACGCHVLKCFFHAAESKWQREVRAYTFLADSGLPVPRLIATGNLSANVPWLLMTRLPGSLAAEAVSQLTPQDRVHAFASAGTLLAQLHSLPVDERLTQAPLSEAAQEYACKMGRHLGEYGASALASTHRADSFARARCWAVELLRFLPPPAQRCCVHGDFSMRNLLLSGADRLWTVSGLFDFERSDYGDAAVDLTRMLIAQSNWSDAAFQAFLEAYAATAAVPSRERILLHLSAIVLEASTWAVDKDRDYCDRLLDVADRVATRPDSLPGLFQPSPGARIHL